MSQREPKEPIEITVDENEPEPPAAPAPAPLVIELEDLPTDEEVAAQFAPTRAFPGFKGGQTPVGLHVTAHCATNKGEYVLALTPRKEGGYWIRVASGQPMAGVGATLDAQGPFAYEPGLQCPYCHASNVLVCECGAVFCHGEKPNAVCPVCQRKLRVAGPAGHVSAQGGGKGGG